MIKQITQAEYNRVMRNRKMESKRFSKTSMWPGIYFKGRDGKYYVNPESGPAAALEVGRFINKQIHAKNSQQSLL